MQTRDITSRDLEAVLAVIALSDEDDADAARMYFADLCAALAKGDPKPGHQNFVSVDGENNIIGVGKTVKIPVLRLI